MILIGQKLFFHFPNLKISLSSLNNIDIIPLISEPNFNWNKFLNLPNDYDYSNTTGPDSSLDTRYAEYILNINNGRPAIPLVLADSIPLLQCKWLYYYTDCDCPDCFIVIVPINREFTFREILTENANPELIPPNIKLTIQEVIYKDRKADLARMKGFYTDLLRDAKANLDTDIVLAAASQESPAITPLKQGWLISIVSPTYKPPALCTLSLDTLFTDPELAIKHCHLVHYAILNDHPHIATESNWSVSNMTSNPRELLAMKPGTVNRVSSLEYGSRITKRKVTCNITCFALI